MNTMADNKVSGVEHGVDWRDSMSMSSCLAYLSNHKMWHDVSFSFKSNDGGKLLPGHRLILSLRSPVFEAMFFGLMADKKDTVDIEDIEYDIFDHVLRYIYTDKTNLDADNVIPILYSAKKYCLPGLVKDCSTFLESSLSCDNVCTIYEHAKLFNMKTLVQTCLVFMSKHSSEVCHSEGAKSLSHESVVEFLSIEDLSGSELDHFRFVNHWADEKCKSMDVEPTAENKRAVLGEIVTKINYALIKPEVFSEEVIPTNLLLAEDQIRWLQYMITRSKSHIEKYQVPSRNRYHIDTRNLGGEKYDSNHFIFTFTSSIDVKLMKLYPLRLSGSNDFERKSVSKMSVHTGTGFNTTRVAEVPVDKLDESGSITDDIDVIFLANKTYTVCIALPNNSDMYGFQKERRSIPTLRMSHTTTAGSASCTIEHIPECVETVEFKVLKNNQSNQI